MVGPTEPEAFDNPGGQALFGLPAEAYDSVLDFGCGCGRVARQLLQQNPRPRRYVGVDVHRGMIEWCERHLATLDPGFRFFHHDVYAHSYAPDNSLRLAQPFPMADGECSLLVAISVFTHLYSSQSEYYLRELARVLRQDGMAVTSWFFFDRDSFPFLAEGPFCLFAGERDPTQAVLYDRRWFLDTVRSIGLAVTRTTPPPVPGHQWTVFLARRGPDTVDRFPLGAEGAEWLSGATRKPIASPAVPPEVARMAKVQSVDPPSRSSWPQPPPLFGVLAELGAARKELEKRKSRS
jgi:SAM-dependent methyltransferase